MVQEAIEQRIAPIGQVNTGAVAPAAPQRLAPWMARPSMNRPALPVMVPAQPVRPSLVTVVPGVPVSARASTP